jgi:hypothetical protein
MLIVLFLLAGCAIPLKMSAPPQLELTDIEQHPYTAGLFVAQDLKAYVYEKATSPLDKMAYPLGDQTYQIFKKNVPLVFDRMVEVDSITPGQGVDLFLQPSIVKFESVIPMPAYNPYTATIVYHVDVYNRSGEKVYAQTATGNGQTSKGYVSGFSAREICADVAQMAMQDAVKQIIEGLSDAEEMANLN